MNAVHYAAQQGNLKVLKYLLALKGGDINKRTTDENGNTPLLLATEAGDLSTVHYLIMYVF